uniref:Minor tail protein n=1 Tax=Mycobacterium phage Farewell TaxID=3158893 RepID=A0AAU8GPP9_9CAUD
MRPRRLRQVVGAVSAAAVLIGTGLGWAARAEALPDPYVPAPPLWCPGNGPGLSASGYGAYCEGRTFPDGSRLNTFRIGAFWQPLRCIVPNGTPTPPLAGPGGCGGVLG